jgi:hypothetical protein
MTEVFEITPQSDSEIWAMLQPPSIPEPDPECVAYEFDFPESQYIAHGCDIDMAVEFAESWRRGEYLPIIGSPEADPVSRKLNQMQSQQTALRK